MRTSLILAALAMASVIGVGSARADEKASSPTVVGGEVTKIDAANGRVTVRGSDGTVREFEASKETLAGMKVGDQIEAKRRPEKN